MGFRRNGVQEKWGSMSGPGSIGRALQMDRTSDTIRPYEIGAGILSQGKCPISCGTEFSNSILLPMRVQREKSAARPLSSEHGIYKTVKASSWPWLSCKGL